MNKSTNKPTDDDNTDLQTEQQQQNTDKPVVQRYFTEDGTPVEPSSLPPKQTIGEPDESARPDVHGRVIPADRADVRNESELDEQDK